MTHVSKLKMDSKISLRIKKNLIASSALQRGLVLESLLTSTETLMLAKRLALIIMLQRGDSTYRISKVLKVSISSVLRFQRMLDSGLFKPVLREIRKRNRSLLNIVELILAAGMPSAAGPRANKRLRRLRRGDTSAE